MDIDKTKAVGLVFAKPSVQVLDLAKTGQVVVRHDKPRAVGARFCQPEHSGARFGKNGGKWQLAVTKRRRWGLFLPNRASKCSIWQKWGQMVVGVRYVPTSRRSGQVVE